VFGASDTIQPSHYPCSICGQQKVVPFGAKINCALYKKIQFARDREYSSRPLKSS